MCFTSQFQWGRNQVHTPVWPEVSQNFFINLFQKKSSGSNWGWTKELVVLLSEIAIRFSNTFGCIFTLKLSVGPLQAPNGRYMLLFPEFQKTCSKSAPQKSWHSFFWIFFLNLRKMTLIVIKCLPRCSNIKN